jgi:hypothetical protein
MLTSPAGGKDEGQKSNYIGVTLEGQRWKAQIALRGGTTYLGLFDEEIKAAQAYDIAAYARRWRVCTLTKGDTRSKIVTGFNMEVHILEVGCQDSAHFLIETLLSLMHDEHSCSVKDARHPKCIGTSCSLS